MSVLIANEDYTLQAVSLGSWIPGNPNLSSDATVINQKATKAKANDKKILINQISWVMIPGACTFTNHTHVSGVSTPPIIATAIKCKADNIPVLRLDDSGKCIGSFTNDSSGSPVICSCNFKIDDSGQNKVRGL